MYEMKLMCIGEAQTVGPYVAFTSMFIRTNYSICLTIHWLSIRNGFSVRMTLFYFIIIVVVVIVRSLYIAMIRLFSLLFPFN